MSHTRRQVDAYYRIYDAIIAARHDPDALAGVIARHHAAWGDLHEKGREYMRKIRDQYMRLCRERAE